MTKYPIVYESIISHPLYKEGITYGRPRRGHAEGTVKAHICDLEINLHTLLAKAVVQKEQFWPLVILIHVHDTFKGESHKTRNEKNVAIEDPKSHASLAKEFLKQFLPNDTTLLNIVQYHDLGYAIYRNYKQKGKLNEMRIEEGLKKLSDLNLYLLFCIIDSCTPSKGREMIRWWVKEVNKRYKTDVKEDIIDFLPAPTMCKENVF